jgi:hypothetical protein
METIHREGSTSLMKQSIIVHIQRPEKPAFNYTVGEKNGAVSDNR